MPRLEQDDKSVGSGKHGHDNGHVDPVEAAFRGKTEQERA
jgi:hypothetical protein